MSVSIEILSKEDAPWDRILSPIFPDVLHENYNLTISTEQ
jgi:hypothetical protein